MTQEFHADEARKTAQAMKEWVTRNAQWIAFLPEDAAMITRAAVLLEAAAREQSVAVNPDYLAEINAISDALRRIGVADSPRLVDRIALAGEELTRLRRAAMDRDCFRKQSERAQRIEQTDLWLLDGLKVNLTDARRDVTDARRDRDSARAAYSQMSDAYDKAVKERQAIDAELDECRRQLESARTRNTSLELYNSSNHKALSDYSDDITAANRRIAELEADGRKSEPMIELRGLLSARPTQSLREAVEDRIADLAAAQQRIAELEAERDAAKADTAAAEPPALPKPPVPPLVPGEPPWVCPVDSGECMIRRTCTNKCGQKHSGPTPADRERAVLDSVRALVASIPNAAAIAINVSDGHATVEVSHVCRQGTRQVKL